MVRTGPRWLCLKARPDPDERVWKSTDRLETLVGPLLSASTFEKDVCWVL